MQYKNFEDFLQTQHQIENPTVLDDELPDNYSEWISSLSPEKWIKFAQKYADLNKPSDAVLRWRENSVKPWNKPTSSKKQLVTS